MLVVLTIIHCIKNHKIREYASSISKRNWAAILLLVGGVLVGWGTTIFVRHVPVDADMLQEFATFAIALSIFSLVSFYSKSDEAYLRKCLYVLLAPLAYSIFLVFPGAAQHFSFVQEGRFFGFTDNQNVIAKILLVPALFFIAYALHGTWSRKKLVHVFLASFLVALLLWATSRGAFVGLGFGSLCILLFASFRKSLKEITIKILILASIIVLGFVFTPYIGKQMVLNRVLNKDTAQIPYAVLETKSLSSIITESIQDKTLPAAPETRYEIWSFYFGQALRSPFGFGPAFNTYLKAYVSEFKSYIMGASHNSYLEIWLWGGLLGLLSFLFLLVDAVRMLARKFRSHPEPFALALLGILAGLAVAMMFDDNSKLYTFWILLALAFQYSQMEAVDPSSVSHSAAGTFLKHTIHCGIAKFLYPFFKDTQLAESSWKSIHQKFEAASWDVCGPEVLGVETRKQDIYAKLLRIPLPYYAKKKTILDIGGGPESLLFRTKAFSQAVVVDPCDYPAHVYEKYKGSGIEVVKEMAETYQSPMQFDEVWCYNVLQHTLSPETILENMKKSSRGTIRIFEWIYTLPHVGHPQTITPAMIYKPFSQDGWAWDFFEKKYVRENGCVGWAAYGVATKNI